jgi:probable O-glycosylation ligase (exosortase A-associated)
MFVIVFGGLPFIFRLPSVGIIYWAWLGLMNPHRQAWGLAYSFPFSQLVGIATLIGLLFSKEPRKFKGGAAAGVLVAFMVWTWITTFFALVPDEAGAMLNRVFKIQFFTFVALVALYKREHVQWLAATIILSIGYYGVKGGLFTLATAGQYRVWGPAGSFIYDNNSLALAVIMSIPLWGYFFVVAQKRWLKMLIAGCMLLSAVSAIGSQSRGALLAIVAMAIFLWARGRRKLLLGFVLLSVGAGIVSFMPNTWGERMETIAAYEEEDSAKQRLDAWSMLFNLAADRPVVGGGFEPYSPEVYDRYSHGRGYEKTQTAHSIYFQVLGEQGFVGLLLFMLIWWFTWKMGSDIIARSRGQPERTWAFWLANAVQASLIAYLVGGAFLSLAYWDMPYYLMVLIAVTRDALVSEGVPAGATENVVASIVAGPAHARPRN